MEGGEIDVSTWARLAKIKISLHLSNSPEWKTGYLNNEPTKYSVSTKGNIRNDKTGKILKPCISINGYQYVTLSIDGKHYNRFIHVLVMETFSPETKTEINNQVNHKYGDKNNNTLNDLEWTSASKNIKHAFRIGIKNAKVGMDNNFNKYSENIIHEICELMCMGYSNIEISNIVKQSYTNIRAIRNGNNWKHVSQLYPIPNFKNNYKLPQDSIYNNTTR